MQHARVAQIQGVAGAGIVDVEALVVGHQAIVGGVVDATHGQGRAALVAFGGVVVDHVQNHFQLLLMQVRDHLLEFGDLAAGQVARVGGEERDAVVAPVVGHAFFQQMLVVDEGVHGQQLDRGNAQLADMLEHVIFHQAGAGAPHRLADRRMAHADAAQVGFVDDRAVPRHSYRLVVAPGVRRVDDLALGHEGRTVAFIETEVVVRVADGVAKQRFGPFEFAHQLLGVGVDQQLVVVETMTVGRVIGTVYAVAVNQPGVSIGQVAVEDLVGVFGQFDAFQLDLAGIVKQAQLHLGGVGGEQRKINTQAIPGGAEGEGQTFTDPRRLMNRRRCGVVGFAHRVAPARGLFSGRTPSY